AGNTRRRRHRGRQAHAPDRRFGGSPLSPPRRRARRVPRCRTGRPRTGSRRHPSRVSSVVSFAVLLGRLQRERDGVSLPGQGGTTGVHSARHSRIATGSGEVWNIENTVPLPKPYDETMLSAAFAALPIRSKPSLDKPP